jgi:hypothetical protein
MSGAAIIWLIFDTLRLISITRLSLGAHPISLDQLAGIDVTMVATENSWATLDHISATNCGSNAVLATLSGAGLNQEEVASIITEQHAEEHSGESARRRNCREC